jgi:hypothetical protein
MSRAVQRSAFHVLAPRSPADTPQVRAFCRSLLPGGELMRVPVNPPGWAEPEYCTDNVRMMIERHGGRAQSGWRIMESLPHVLLEAEFHVIWISPDGEALDVTPRRWLARRCSSLIPRCAMRGARSTTGERRSGPIR